MKLIDLAPEPFDIICEFIQDRRVIRTIAFINRQVANIYSRTSTFFTHEVCRFLLDKKMNVILNLSTDKMKDIDWMQLTGRDDELIIAIYGWRHYAFDSFCKYHFIEEMVQQYSTKPKVAICERVTYFSQYPSLLIKLLKYFRINISDLKFPEMQEPVEITNLKRLFETVKYYQEIPIQLLEVNKQFLLTGHVDTQLPFGHMIECLPPRHVKNLGSNAFKYALLVNPKLVKRVDRVGFDMKRLTFDEKLFAIKKSRIVSISH
jgi:hypothetical protein